MDRQEIFHKTGIYVRRILKWGVIAANIVMAIIYLVLIGQWIRGIPDRETRQYVRLAKETDVPPYYDAVRESFDRYLLPGQEVVIVDSSYRACDNAWDYEIRENYTLALCQSGEEKFRFWAQVREAENISEDAQDIYPLENSKCVVLSDFVQQAFCRMLTECEEQYREENGCYVFSKKPVANWEERPYTAIYGLGLCEAFSFEREGMEWLFREAYLRMHEWQEKSGEKMHTDIWISRHFVPDWRESDYPKHRLDFSESYGEEQRELFGEMAQEVLEETESLSMYYRKTWLIDIWQP